MSRVMSRLMSRLMNSGGVMKRIAVPMALLLLLAGVPLLAQDDAGRAKQLTVWASQAEFDTTELPDGFGTDFESQFSYGASVNMYLTRHFSAEVSVFSLRSDASLPLDGGTPLDLGKLELLPVMVGAQFHVLGESRFDPYIGAGAAYVMADDLFSADLEAVGIGALRLEDKVTYYLNAGLGVQLTRGLALVADGRYIAYETGSRSAVTGVNQDLELNPMVLSAGLRLRF